MNTYEIEFDLAAKDCDTNISKQLLCKNCGKKLDENAKFCDSCGTNVDELFEDVVGVLSNKWAWALALIPIIMIIPTIMMIAMFFEMNIYLDYLLRREQIANLNDFSSIAMLIYAIGTIVLIVLDLCELGNKNQCLIPPVVPVWAGKIGIGVGMFLNFRLSGALNPVYLFLRAGKTNGKYGYAVVALVLTALNLILWGVVKLMNNAFEAENGIRLFF